MQRFIKALSFLLFMPFMALAQTAVNPTYQSVFQSAYEACPDIPQGLLEAISFTNTQCHHLTDANYFNDGPEAMPRAYGLMGLVKDGKGYFRENLHLVAKLSGISETEILESPEKNVLAYAKAFDHLAKESKATETKGYLSVIQQLSELPIGQEKDVYPMQSMLYSVCVFLNDDKKAMQYGFPKYDIDLKAVFAEHLNRLASPSLIISDGIEDIDTLPSVGMTCLQKSPDYPPAIWDPAPECNWEPRTKEVSAVVIHYTEGSYAGCISWFKNCEAETSAHYVIRSFDGQITQMVLEKDKAWHAASANGYTIGIEHEAYGNVWSFFTEEMYQSSADLVRSICSRYQNINGLRTHDRDTLDNGFCVNYGYYNLGGEGSCIQIKGHQHYPDQNHTDPGPYWDWNYYYKLINESPFAMVLEGEEGRLDHQDYGNDERQVWVIRGPEESIIELDFSSFELEDDFDFLWIYDGDNVFAPKIGRWNTQSPETVQASGNVMCVEFRSDCLTTDAGWTASWKALTDTTSVYENGWEAGVFPNPTKDRFTVYGIDESVTEVAVFDMLGRQMTPPLRFKESYEIDASDWPDGIYIIRIGTPTTSGKVTKLVKAKCD